MLVELSTSKIDKLDIISFWYLLKISLSRKFGTSSFNKVYVSIWLIFDSHEVVHSNGLTTTSLPPTTTCYNMALKEEEYYEIAKARIKNVKPQLKLFDI